ncbi:MAG: branched-chain alpha-keto acid dehydrogenase subunit E2 [Desulfobacteraceae bacterium]|nr:MAG: branched-chain alpha-keto acid dehydrogenase subunit E2 [Desulfobacteraceae bacterium]
MIQEVRIPEISENVTSGKVVKVLVKAGDMVDVDDVLIEFETEKALVEIPSTAKGKIVELLAKEGQEMQVGDLIAKVESEGEAEQAPPEPEAEPGAVAEKAAPEPDAEAKKPLEKAPAVQKEAEAEEEPQQPAKVEKKAEPVGERHPPVAAAPSVRRFARELGVDILQVKGSGPGGRITQDDIKTAVKQGRAHAAAAGGAGGLEEPALPDFGRWGEIEAVELPAVRRLTARSVSVSWRTVAHVTQFDRADITHLEAFIRSQAPKLQKQGIKLTLTAVVMKVCAAALVKFPRFNASIDPANNRLIFKKYVHIGMAVDTERGLLVPVIRDAERKGISRLAADIVDLAERSRTKKIKPDEMEGGTFTISNQGGIGGTQFTPIVMWPQVAILGISRTAIEPVHVDGRFEPRSILPLSLSYDHRIIDGADAARFMRWVCEALEMPFAMMLD